MKAIKSKLLFVTLLISSPFSTHSMEQPESYKRIGWVALAGGAILGGAVALNKFLSYIHSEPSAPFNFGGLPSDAQRTIISLLGHCNSARSLEEAAQTINALAQTNHFLNDLINEPHFCLELIKNLSKRYKLSDLNVAKALGTKEAQLRYHLQNNLKSLVCSDEWSKVRDQIEKLCVEGADLDFTYGGAESWTVLMWAAGQLNIELFDFLLEKGASINFANNEGETALVYAAIDASYGNPQDLQKLLARHKDFDINQQDSKGNTVLMRVLGITSVDTDVVKILLAAGADPELANFAGTTPLAYVKNTWVLLGDRQAILHLFGEAIQKKYENKI